MAKGSNTMETGFGTTRQVHTENVSINPRGLTSPGDPDGVVSNGRGLKGVLLNLIDESQNGGQYFPSIAQL